MADGDFADLKVRARAELADTGTLWSDAYLSRTLDEVTGDFSRLMPLEKVYELTLSLQVNAETVSLNGTTLATASLANHPIEWGSVKVENNAQTVTYTINTDYTVDYFNGTITPKSGGSIAAGANNHKITYQKSRIALDLSSLSGIITPIRVIYPLSDHPTSEVSWDWWGQVLWLKTEAGARSQSKMSLTSEHLQIWYNKQHTAPTTTVAGTWPRWMDELAVKGMAAYALFIKSREQYLQAITDLTSARTNFDTESGARISAAITALDALSTASIGVYAKITAALDLSDTGDNPYGRIKTALDKVNTDLTDVTNSARVALQAVATTTSAAALAKVDTYLASATESAKEALSLLGPGEISDFQALIVTALAKIQTYLAGTTESSKEALGLLGPGESSDFQALAKAALDKVTTFQNLAYNITGPAGAIVNADNIWTVNAPGEEDYLNQLGVPSGSVDFGAQDYLEIGDGLINQFNAGQDVPELNRRYAETELNIAQHYAQRRQDFLTEAQRYVELASGYINEAQGRVQAGQLKVQEASQWIQLANGFVGEGQARVNAGQLKVQEAQGWIALAEGFVAEAHERNILNESMVAKANSYINLTQQWVNEAMAGVQACQVVFNEAAGWTAKGNLYIAEAAQNTQLAEMYLRIGETYMNTADRAMLVGDKFHADASARHADYWQKLESRVQQARQRSWSSTRQYAASNAGAGPTARLSSTTNP